MHAFVPVRDDERRLHLPDDAGDISARFVGVGNLAIVIWTDDHLRAEGRCGGSGLAAFLFAVGVGSERRISTFAECEMQQHDAIAALGLLQQQCAAGQLHVAGVGTDRQDGPRRFRLILRRGDERACGNGGRGESASEQHPYFGAGGAGGGE